VQQEKWKYINLDNKCTDYQVSDQGNIKDKFNNLLPLFKSKDNYLRVKLLFNNKSYVFLVHRLVALAFIPNPENKPTVNHKKPGKENKIINIIDNLEWVTYSEQQHANKYHINNQPKGEKCHLTKYNNDIIHGICQKIEEGYEQKEICKEFNVSNTFVNKLIKTGFRNDIVSQYNILNNKMYRTGPKTQYSSELINEICKLLDKKYTNKEIREILNIENKNLVKDIRSRKFVKYISNNYDFWKNTRESSTTIETNNDKLIIVI
jgi:transposase